MRRKFTARGLFEKGIRSVDELQWANAKKAFQKSLRLQPNFPDAILQLGMLEFREGKLQTALRLHERALVQARSDIPTKIKPEQWWHQRKTRAYLRALRAIGLVYYRMGKRRKAIATFYELLRLNPDDHLGVQYFLDALMAGKSWRAMDEPLLKKNNIQLKKKQKIEKDRRGKGKS